MRYVVEIDLNYGVLPETEVHAVWQMLRTALLEAGFLGDRRRFVSNQEPATAARAAQGAIEAVERRLGWEGRSVYRYVRDFYGYPVACVENLLVPPTTAIEVREAS